MLHDLVARYGPALVFANALAASLGLPVPAMPTLVVFGALAALSPASAGAQLGEVLILAVAGTLIGDSIWFLAGRLYGGGTLKAICRLSLSRDSCVKKTERFFGRWGVRVLTVAKLVPGLSLVSVPMAGAMGTPYRAFLKHDGVGAALWAGMGLALGVLFSRQIDFLLATAGQLGRASALVIAVLIALYTGWRWVRRRALIRELALERIDVRALQALIEGGNAPIVFDIRSDETRKLDPFTIPGARLVDDRDIESVIAAYRPDQTLVVYCACPNEISAAAMTKRLREAGFADARPLRGGLDAWRDAGHAVVPLVEAPPPPVPLEALAGPGPKTV